jgi:hypothetical protein
MMKREEILLKPKVKGRENFAKYRELLFKFWVKFYQLSSIFHGINKSWQKSACV